METEERAIIKKYLFWFVLLLFCANVFYTNVVVLNREKYKFEERNKLENLKLEKSIEQETKLFSNWKSRVKSIADDEDKFSNHLFPKERHWQLVKEMARAGEQAQVTISTISCGQFSESKSSTGINSLPIRISVDGDYPAMKRFTGWLQANQTITCDSFSLRYDTRSRVIKGAFSITGWFK